MRAYVYEPRKMRQEYLASELEGVEITAHFVDEDFFVSGKDRLAQQIESSDAILIGEDENMHPRRIVEV